MTRFWRAAPKTSQAWWPTAAPQLARDNQRLVIGPWDHVNWGRPDSTPAPLLKDIGAVGDSPINDLMLAWFDHFLKGTAQRRRREAPGRLLRHGRQHLEVGDELASAADKLDDVLPLGARRHRGPQR